MPIHMFIHMSMHMPIHMSIYMHIFFFRNREAREDAASCSLEAVQQEEQAARDKEVRDPMIASLLELRSTRLRKCLDARPHLRVFVGGCLGRRCRRHMAMW